MYDNDISVDMKLCKRMFAVDCIILIKVTCENVRAKVQEDLDKTKHAKKARTQTLYLFIL